MPADLPEASPSQLPWAKPWLLIALILTIGIGLSFTAFRFGVGWERNKLDSAFNATARSLGDLLRQELEINMDAVHALSAFFESDPGETDYGEFQTFVRGIISRHRDIQALAWVPKVAGSQRAAFEQAGNRLFGPDFRISERKAAGRMSSAEPRSEYFPVYYLAPLAGNRPVLGFDLATDAISLSAMNQAAASGKAAASGRIALRQDTGQEFGYQVFCPVLIKQGSPTAQKEIGRHLRGFALGVFRVDELVRLAMPKYKESGIDIFLFDANEPEKSRSLLFGYCPANPKLAEQPDETCVIENAGTDLHYKTSMEVAGRSWVLLVVATPGYVTKRISNLPHAVLATGLLATLLSLLLVVRGVKSGKEIQATNLELHKEIIERRNAEADLALFKYTVAKMRDAAYLMNREGRLTFVNDSACAASGHGRDELLEMSICDIEQDLSPGQWRRRWMDLAEKKHLNLESRHRRKSGESFSVEISMNLVEYRGEQIICAFARDITERKLAEKEMLRRDEIFRGVSRMAEVGGWEYDVASGEGFWTEEVALIHDMDPEDTTSKSVGLGFYHGEYLRKIQRALSEAEQDGKSFDLELEMVSGSGAHKWVRSIGWPVKKGNAVVKLRGSFQDITKRKQAETALRESENKFRSITENAADYIFIKDGSRRYTFANSAMIKMLELPEEEILGKTPEEIFGPDQGRVVKEVDDRTFAGETVNETRLLTIKGKPYFLNTIQTPLSVQDGKVTSIMGIVRDVSDIKGAEQALKTSQALMKKIFDASPAQITLTTLDDGRYLDANSAFLAATGYSYEEVIGNTCFELGLWSDHEDRIEPLERLQKDGRLQDYEISFRMKGGVERDFLWNAVTLEAEGKPCSVNVMIDITDRLYAENAIKENEEALSQRLAEINHLYQTSPVGLAFVDRELRYLRINQSLADLNGIPVQEHIGKTFAEVHPDLVAELEPLYRRVLDTGEPVTNMSIHGTLPSNPALQRDWLINYYPVKAADGSIMGVGTVVQDITDLKEAERALTRINEELEERVSRRTAELEAANRELEAFAYSVSHDLRAPLRALDGFSQALLEDHLETLDQEGKDYLSRIRAASQRMGDLIDDMLKLSRITRFEMQPREVDLSQLAWEVAGYLKAGEPRRSAKFLIQPGVKAKGDENLLSILLENLMGNAWKYTSKQAEATIEFGALAPDRGTSADSDPARVYFVRDNGIGFNGNYKEKLFQPFRRLHSAEDFPGTGIGLATAQRIINRHRGAIWAESQEGSGATFFFKLWSVGK